MGLLIHVDGGSRGNPGPAGAGVVIQTDEGELIHEAGYFLGRQTNNAAEYLALLHALRRAERRGEQPLSIRSDSELLVRQITGEYRVKSPKLQKLFEQVQTLLLRVAVWNIRHIDRESNTRADELANLAMDRRSDVIVVDAGVSPSTPPAATGDTGASSSSEEVVPPPVGAGDRQVCVSAFRLPAAGECPAGRWIVEPIVVGAQLPAGVCVHAAHALVSTILAVQNTDPDEFSAVPTLTIRCSRPTCGATFHVSPCGAGNGVPPTGT